MYGSDEFAALAGWCRDILDRVAEGLPESHRQRLAAAFLTSSRHELRFWDAAQTWRPGRA